MNTATYLNSIASIPNPKSVRTTEAFPFSLDPEKLVVALATISYRYNKPLLVSYTVLPSILPAYSLYLYVVFS